MKPLTDYYLLGRTAAESGVPADGHGLIVGTVQHRDWARGHSDWHEEHDLTPTVPMSELEKELIVLGEAGA